MSSRYKVHSDADRSTFGTLVVSNIKDARCEVCRAKIQTKKDTLSQNDATVVLFPNLSPARQVKDGRLYNTVMFDRMEFQNSSDFQDNMPIFIDDNVLVCNEQCAVLFLLMPIVLND